MVLPLILTDGERIVEMNGYATCDFGKIDEFGSPVQTYVMQDVVLIGPSSSVRVFAFVNPVFHKFVHGFLRHQMSACITVLPSLNNIEIP